MDNYTGKRLDGRYEIQEVVGVGGMAVVYKAYDNIDDRIVAIKILKEEYLANKEFRRRFKNESKAIAVLSHPNIVKVYDVSYGDRLQYIVMEYVEGITLKEYIEQQGKLQIKESVHFTTQILRALQHAHDRGVVHRDIKPQNIMLLSNGNIKVTDFGIARFSYSETKTMTDSAIGSVHYISPEQARGELTDDKADIYSVGVVMYEMLTGQLPFQSDNSVKVALMQLQDEPRSLRELNSSIPIGLEQIVLHAMQKAPANRYQSAAEMLLDIEEFKRNPQVRFRDPYFVDDSPTRHVQADSKTKVMPAVKTPGQENKPDTGKMINRRAVLVGAVMGFVVFAFIALGVLYFFSNAFESDTITIAKFINQNYEKDIMNNPAYKRYNFEIEYEQNSMFEEGCVCAQSPSPGVKVSSDNNTVILSVAKAQKLVTVPDVYGKIVTQAQRVLDNKGFTVVLSPQVSLTDEDGTVLRTSPERNKEVNEGSTITVYYASTEELIEVPKIVGYDLETAQELLESLNLTLSDNIDRVDSTLPENEILEQSHEPGTQVIAGTAISVSVSTGVPQKGKGTISIQLPDDGPNTLFEVYVQNEKYMSKSLLMDGSTYAFEIEGSGDSTPVKVYIDGSEYYSCTVNFTKDPITVSNQSYTSSRISPALNRAAMPSVTGMSLDQAKAKLTSSGFRNVTYQYQTVSNPSQVNMVLSQSPEPSTPVVLGFTPTISTDTLVTLIIGEMPADTTAAPVVVDG